MNKNVKLRIRIIYTAFLLFLAVALLLDAFNIYKFNSKIIGLLIYLILIVLAIFFNYTYFRRLTDIPQNTDKFYNSPKFLYLILLVLILNLLSAMFLGKVVSISGFRGVILDVMELNFIYSIFYFLINLNLIVIVITRIYIIKKKTIK